MNATNLITTAIESLPGVLVAIGAIAAPAATMVTTTKRFQPRQWAADPAGAINAGDTAGTTDLATTVTELGRGIALAALATPIAAVAVLLISGSSLSGVGLGTFWTWMLATAAPMCWAVIWARAEMLRDMALQANPRSGSEILTGIVSPAPPAAAISIAKIMTAITVIVALAVLLTQ